jgi:hypothetical protein
MLISHRHRFIYTKTSKTASTSVESYFEPFCMPEGTWQQSHERQAMETEAGVVGFRGENSKGQKWHGHMAAAQIRDQIGKEIWDNYFKFCVIRDPFDKAVSAFHFAEHMQDRRSGLQKLLVHIKRFFRGASPEKRFRKWVARGRFKDDRNKYMIDGEVCVDYFIRFEALDEGIRHVCDHLGLPYEPERLPGFKKGIRPQGRDLTDYYDKATARRIAKQFAWEIETFGYQPPVNLD